MAIVSCPECGKQVSDRASACPNCGCPIVEAQPSNVAKLYIAQHPNVPGCIVPIKHPDGRLMANARAGAVFTITEMDRAYTYNLCGTFGGTMLTVTLEPGKKYKATWGVGFFSPKITSCYEVDIIDA